MTSVVLSKLALATPLGLTVETTQAAIFGSITGFAETEVVHDDQPVRASLLPTLPPAASREDRMLFLGRRAPPTVRRGSASADGSGATWCSLSATDAHSKRASWRAGSLNPLPARPPSIGRHPIDWGGPASSTP